MKNYKVVSEFTKGRRFYKVGDIISIDESLAGNISRFAVPLEENSVSAPKVEAPTNQVAPEEKSTETQVRAPQSPVKDKMLKKSNKKVGGKKK